MVWSVNPVIGDILANAEGPIAPRLERVSLDDIAHRASPPLHPQHGAYHHE